MLYLKIVNIFVQNKELKNGIGILVGQAFFVKVRNQNSQILFWSITQEQLGLLKF